MAAWGITLFLRALGATLRLTVKDDAGYLDPSREGRCIVALWHNRMLVAPIYYARFCKAKPLAVLTSASRDGELLAAVVRNFGIAAVRGSSSRRGAAALRELAEALENGNDVLLTPDGPRGPRYTMGSGLVYLAQKMRLPIMRLGVEYEAYWTLKTWDRFRIPKPFSKVTLTFHPFDAIDGARTIDSERERIATLMRAETA